MKSAIYLAFLVFLLPLFVSAYSSMGISPPLEQHIYTGEVELFGRFTLYTDGEKNMHMQASGDLAQYIRIENGSSEFDLKIKGGAVVKYSFTLPPNLAPGTYRTEIIATQVLTPEERIVAGSGANAFAAISHTILVRVPNDGKFLEAKIEYEPKKIEPGTVVYFTIPLLNFGTEDLEDLHTSLTIFAPGGIKIASSDTTRIPLLPPAGTSNLKSFWSTVNQSSGEYRVKGAIEYGGKSPANIETVLRIGEIRINIVGVRPELGAQIGKVYIDIESNWNDGIENVYAEVDIKQGTGVLSTLRTSSINLDPWGKDTLVAFWERGTLKAGNYNLDIRVYYYDKLADKQVQVTLTDPSEEKPLYQNTLVLILIILLALLVLVNVSWLILRAKRKDKK